MLLKGSLKMSMPYICPTCDATLSISKDDIGTTYYQCATHGFIQNPKQMVDPSIITDPFKEVLEPDGNTPIDCLPEDWLADGIKSEIELVKKLKTDLEMFSLSPDVEEMFLEQIHQTVSAYDDHIVRIGFHVALSVYGTPLNLALKCESGSGKTYSTLQTLSFLPPENICEVGSQSPKVFTHLNGIRKTKDGELLDEKDEPKKPVESHFKDEVLGMGDAGREAFAEAKRIYAIEKPLWDEKVKNSIYEVDLRNQVYSFLESINIETFKMLKTTMSHDAPHIDHSYVDENGKVHITRLVGAPVMIFNSLDTEYISEFATRCLTATPNTRKEKVEDANRISNNKSCYPWAYSNDVYHKQLIREYIRKIRDSIKEGKLSVLNPFDGIYEAFAKDAVRDMRDFNKFLELLPSYAMFKLFQRPIVTINKKRYIIPTIQDVLDAKSSYDAILETTKTGSDYRVLEFYWQVIADKLNGIEAEAATDIYNSNHKNSRQTTVKTVRSWLFRLEALGWVDVRAGKNEDGFTDRRINNYLPMKKRADNVLSTPDCNSAALLASVCEKAFDKWLNNVSSILRGGIILRIDGTAKKLSIEELKTIVLKNSQYPPTKDGHIINKDLSSISKKEGEITADSKTGVIGTILTESSTVDTTKTIHYQKLAPHDCHKCDMCQTYQADYIQASKYYCEGCLKTGRERAAQDGFILVEDN
jgi:hypothetical protein